jgi:hypothetical protein
MNTHLDTQTRDGTVQLWNGKRGKIYEQYLYQMWQKVIHTYTHMLLLFMTL